MHSVKLQFEVALVRWNVL